MSWLLPDWQRTVVFIGKQTKESKKFIGTGVLLSICGIFVLATAKHVVFDEDEEERGGLFISFNSKDNKIVDRTIDEIKKTFGVKWALHTNKKVDVALIPFGFDSKKDDIKSIGEDTFFH